MAETRMNGDTEDKGLENSAISIDTKGLASRKVIQVKIDNPLLSNDDSDDDVERNNPFCIKVSKGQVEDHVTSKLTNGNKSNSSVEGDTNIRDSPTEVVNNTDIEDSAKKQKGDIPQLNNSDNKDDSVNNPTSSELAPRDKVNDSTLEDENSQCSSASGRSSGKSDGGRSENNFGDVEDENSRESIKFSEKLDNEEAHELSKVVDSTVKSDEEKKSVLETKRAGDVKEDSNNDAEKRSESHINKKDVGKVENAEKEKTKKDSSDSEKHSNKESSVKHEISSGEKSKPVDEEKMDVDSSENENKTKMDIDANKSGQNCDMTRERSELRKDMEKNNTDAEREKSSKEDDGENMEVDTTNEMEKVHAGNEKDSVKSEKSNEKSVDRVKDEDGTDILITVNEDHSDDESKEELLEAAKNSNDSKNDSKKNENIRGENTTRSETPKIKSVFENDVVIVDLSAESPKDDKSKPAWNPPASSNTTIKSMLKPIAPTPSTKQLPVTSTAGVNGTIMINGQQYVQQIMYDVNGRKQIVQVPISNTNKHIYSTMLSQAALAVKAPSLQSVPPAAKPAPPKPKTGLARFKEVDDNIPIASWEQLDLIKYEWSTKKYDNTFWAGQCPINKTAELSAPTKFLMDLGSDLVKKSAYDQITRIQGIKEKAGKLGKQEKDNLGRMTSIVKELKEKLKHLDITHRKCEGCNFVTESENVMEFHKEHPHMDPPMDPYGDLKCSHVECDFKTGRPTDFAAHMESVHKMKARVYDKPEAHRCSLCYYEAKMKNQLTKHKFKCVKQFKPNMNQAPHYTDISYCLKNIFYKYQIKRLVPPPKPTPVVKAVTRNYSPLRPTILQTSKVPVSVPFAGNQPIVVNSSNIQYRPVFTLNNLPNQPVQLINMPVSHPSTNSTSQPTVNELLKMKPSTTSNSSNVYSSLAPKSAFEVCEICGGYVKDKMSLRIHFFYAHKVDLPANLFNRGLPPLFCEVCQKGFWTSQGLGKHKQSLKHYGQSNLGKNLSEKPIPKCWICFQTPENLYSHIHKFHRLSTSECMALRRCMFCGIQSNTRRDLEIHMAASHGVLIKGEQNAKVASKPPASGLVRNNFCVFCSLHFNDNTQLTLHCLRDHATCSACGMVVANSSHLKTHICKNSPSKKCEVCGIKNLKPQYYIKHVTSHLKKCSVKIRRVTEKEIEKAMGKERKAEMDLQKQKELFTKLEADIWNEIESRRKRDREEDKVSKDPIVRKRKMENEKEEKVKKKLQKLEDEDRDYKPKEGSDDVVVVDD